MASGLLMLLDDIATILDDVAVLTKVAAKKTAGILGDDLALNAQQVTGIKADRELPVVWAVAKGSLVNKIILVPAALLLSAIAVWAIIPLMIVGGAYLCFEGCEKIAHKFFHRSDELKHKEHHRTNVANPQLDIVAEEKTKIKGAIRTDFILSAEIVVITLGAVAHADFTTRLGVLVSISLLMTVGVYGLVAAIVKLDDVGLKLIESPRVRLFSRTRVRAGHAILAFAPYLMKFLSIAGTAAMFLVGGGILAHGIPVLHHWIENLKHNLESVEGIGGVLSWFSELALHGLLGLFFGTIVLLAVATTKSVFKKLAKATTKQPTIKESDH